MSSIRSLATRCNLTITTGIHVRDGSRCRLAGRDGGGRVSALQLLALAKPAPAMVCATDARTIDAVAVGRRMADALLQLNGGADPRDVRQLLAVRQVARATNGAAVRFPARGQRARDRDQQGSMEEKT